MSLRTSSRSPSSKETSSKTAVTSLEVYYGCVFSCTVFGGTEIPENRLTTSDCEDGLQGQGRRCVLGALDAWDDWREDRGKIRTPAIVATGRARPSCGENCLPVRMDTLVGGTPAATSITRNGRRDGPQSTRAEERSRRRANDNSASNLSATLQRRHTSLLCHQPAPHAGKHACIHTQLRTLHCQLAPCIHR